MKGVLGEGYRGYFEDENGERLERRRGEEIGGERRLSGGEEMSEALVNGHLVDEVVNVRDIGRDGETDSGEQRSATMEWNC